MEKTKKCPYCGEEILAVAKKCKHCGEWLEEKVKEQKACPICGEMVDIDISQCPHCGEPTLFSDTHDESVSQEEQKVSNLLYYCKSCDAELPFDAQSCNKCGDQDPFFFKKIKKFEIISQWVSIIVVLGAWYISSNYMGFTLGITSKWLNVICVLGLIYIFYFIVYYLVKNVFFNSQIKDFEIIMQSHFDDHGHPERIELWKKKLNNSNTY